ncbi:hypothetical protein P3T86_14005 (plasmid) [Staphylococcus nepalensis]|uniref:hypothetical protein n=1 Tax=Staphylococcus nepalensis TaxID=214473 RepID=UPI002B25959A|nr:hypothetical protein [Staphylococcus nepalensis]WQL21593.1 hypothetical protein P3T86_14005 [Staphylococcus nepalensis]
MLDKPLTAFGNILHFIGNIGVMITVIVIILMLLYILIYSKTDFFINTTSYRFKENVKKWVWIMVAIAVISGLFHVLGAWVTPNVLN